MAFSLRLFVFALCVSVVFSADPLSFECTQSGLQSGFASGAVFKLNCTNPSIVYITETLTVNTNFTWQMNGVILRGINDASGNKFGLMIASSFFAISNGIIEVPISISDSVGTISSVNIRNFTAGGSFSSSLSSTNSNLTFTKSSTFATAGVEGTLYVSGGTFTCLESSLIFNTNVSVTGSSFSLNNNATSTFHSCSIKGNSFSMKNSTSLIETTNTIWDVPTSTVALAFFGDYNVFQSSNETVGNGNTYGAKKIFEAPIESPTTNNGKLDCNCPFATAWIPLAACSPAINVAPYSRFDTDQNGSPRNRNGAVDAGAIESYLSPCLTAEFSKSITQCVNSVIITLTLSSKSAANVTLSYTTEDATAISGVDYVPIRGVLVFPQWTNQVTISVQLIVKTVYTLENKIFRVLYSNAANSDLKDKSTIVKLTCMAPVTTSAITTSAMTTGSVTSGLVTSARMTTHRYTTAKMTTQAMTTAIPITSSAITSAAITTSALTTGTVTTATTAVTSGIDITTRWLTTGKIDNSKATTSAVKLTTGYLAGTPNTTSDCDVLSLICKMGYCNNSATFTIDGSVYRYSDFNAITFGDFYLDNGDTEGRLLVGGSLFAAKDGISIGFELQTNSFPYSAIIGKNAVWLNGEVYPRGTGIFVGSNFTGADSIKAQITGYCSQVGCLEAEFTKMKNYYLNVSKALSSLSDTASSVMSYSQLNITCNTGAAIQVLTLDAATFSTITDYAFIGCAPTSLFLVNIRGTANVVFQGHDFRTPAVLFNVIESTKVFVNATVLGSILAPVSNYTQTAGYVEGQVVTASNLATVQINLPACANATSITTGGASGDFVQSGEASTAIFSIALAVVMSLAIML